jgi:NAD+ synthase (glutamine-hydrolysing)
MDDLGIPRERVQALTMPGFGTTGRTKTNALALMKSLGVAARECDIRAICLDQMKALGHSPFGIKLDGETVETLGEKLRHLPPDNRHDLVFENVQARARTSLLMNAGFVVGTGDLSELALGWCTYNADHMSMYNVNVSIPKTLVKFLVKWAAEHEFDGDARRTLLDVADTEITPELLPTDANGQIVQATESTIGPYELIDFFLYHFPSFWSESGEATVPCRACGILEIESAGRSAALAAGLSAPILRQPVQAELSAGRSEGRHRQPLPARRLAHAERCRSASLVG